MAEDPTIHNPIDEKKITSSPSLLPYAHTVGGAIIRPMDQGKTRGLAMKAMYQQTDNHLLQIKQQVELLITQAQAIHDRIAISESIYTAECRFKPNINETYYLYAHTDGHKVLSMIGPQEWGTLPSRLTYEASITLLADHTWDVIDKAAV
jgi:Protein of unknown function (DUF2452)